MNVVERARLTRSQFERWFANRGVGQVVTEACGSAHHWGRWFNAEGIDARLLPAGYVRAYVKRNKTDAAALLEAARASDIVPVRVKSVEKQALQALHRVKAGTFPSGLMATYPECSSRKSTSTGVIRSDNPHSCAPTSTFRTKGDVGLKLSCIRSAPFRIAVIKKCRGGDPYLAPKKPRRQRQRGRGNSGPGDVLATGKVAAGPMNLA